LARYLTDPEKIREGLERLGLTGEVPKIAKAERPEQEEISDRTPDSDGVDPPSPDHPYARERRHRPAGEIDGGVARRGRAGLR
jgi:hypothetical protein